MVSNLSRQSRRGFTLIEVLATIFIIGLLLSISLPAYKNFKSKAEKATCINHLRVVHSGFSNFLVDRGRWPQMPSNALSFSESDYFAWWAGAIAPYGVGPESWMCPSDKIRKKQAGAAYSSYVPTMFDGHSQTPYRWSQPWLMERGDFHGKGAHIIMPDGSVSSSQNPFAGY